MFGVPDCGKVCSETHLPGYLAELDALRRLGVSKVLCVAVGEPAAAQRWAEQLRVDPSQVRGARSSFLFSCFLFISFSTV